MRAESFQEIDQDIDVLHLRGPFCITSSNGSDKVREVDPASVAVLTWDR